MNKRKENEPYRTAPFSIAFREVLGQKGWGEKSRCAKSIGKSIGYLSELSSGKKQGTEEVRREISAFLGYDYEALLEIGKLDTSSKDTDEHDKAVNIGHITRNRPKTSRVPTGASIPVISWVQAGEWQEIVDSFQPEDAEEWINVFQNVSPATFALRISGDSMEPEFREGEIIAIDPAIQPETGKYVVAKIESDNGNNGEATFKQFIRDGNQVFLKPLNPAYPLMDMTRKKFRIVGCVVQKTKEY